MLSLSLIHNQQHDHIGADCESKDISWTFDENAGPAQDYTLAHHGVASCASLYPYKEDEDLDDVPRVCCYAKVKYKIEGDKYTRKGCYPVDTDEDIDNEISILENAFGDALAEYFEGQDVEIKDVEADIDCNSNFLKYSILLILIALL